MSEKPVGVTQYRTIKFHSEEKHREIVMKIRCYRREMRKSTCENRRQRIGVDVAIAELLVRSVPRTRHHVLSEG
jgi:hypothetical protein